jgi:bifunctional enzyme CysN/CysC
LSAKKILRVTTTGSVDDGKSTLIGRLLYETNCIFEDQYAALENIATSKGDERVDLSLLLDGLAAEREQGITIDVAYRYFSTDKCKFIVADTPGHEQYTRNMVTGASTADISVILIDARSGIQTQSKRHGFLASLLGIKHMIVAVNKMDLVGYSQDVFNSVVDEYSDFAKKLEIQHITFIPVSALSGDNVTVKSPNMAWYRGLTLLGELEDVYVEADNNLVDFRFPVQIVVRPNQDYRGYAGRVSSGSVKKGEGVVILPSMKESKIKAIEGTGSDIATFGQSAVITLEDELDISRGDMIVRKDNLPFICDRFSTHLCWMDEEPLKINRGYIIKHTTRAVTGFVSKVSYKINVNTLHREETKEVNLNDIVRAEVKTSKPIFFDPYLSNKSTGSFILIDPFTNKTVAAGMVKKVFESHSKTQVSSNVGWEGSVVPKAAWERLNGHPPKVLWLTGLSGSGKTTIAKELVRVLYSEGKHAVLLDGDNVRHALCGDLGFSKEDRKENIRRIAEVAKIFYEQGNIVVCALISPFKEDRDFVRSLIPQRDFVEVYVRCGANVCIQRDPKGLYKKAIKGEIAEFTGISSPYEEPENPEVTVCTDKDKLNDIVSTILLNTK